ncbi:MAG TPA: HipA family kinase [Gemmatimonadaceae bacterium]|nr:HipA family kinase [Gemmatimonadaceae bacterium]
MSMTIPRLLATRYVQPLREGGSLPAVVDTDGGLYVAKFRGAGQGAKVLVAEIIAHGIATRLGMPVPDLAIIALPDRFGQSEPDSEIQELLKASRGINIGLRYLDGAFNFDPVAAQDVIDARFASTLVWMDAFITNPDRTARNPNLMVWQRQPWLIDHGAALYMHYDWPSVNEARITTPFPLISQHVLLLRAADLDAANQTATAALDDDVLRAITDSIPEALLLDPVTGDDSIDAVTARARYVDYLRRRRDASPVFTAAAIAAREALRASPAQPYSARR